MKGKGVQINLVLLGVAVVLSVIAWFVIDSERKGFTDIDKIPRLFEGFTAENVRFLVLSKPKADPEKDAKKDEKKAENGTAKPPEEKQEKPDKDEKGAKKEVERERLVLVKQETTWKIGEGELAGVPVQAGKVENDILKHLKEIRVHKKSMHAAADPAFLERTGLKEEQATLIQCLDAAQTPVAELLLGKDVSGGKYEADVMRGYYVRSKTSSDVLVYEEQYWMLSLKADDWTDKKIHDFEQSKLKTISLKNPKGQVTFYKDKVTDAEWKCDKKPEGMGAVRQQEVTNFLASRFMRVDASRFLGPLAQHRDQRELHLDPADIEVSAEIEDATVKKPTFRLSIGKKIADKPEYYAKAEGNEFLLALGDWVVTPYEKDPKDFFDPGAVTSLPTTQTQPSTGGGEPKDGAASRGR